MRLMILLVIISNTCLGQQYYNRDLLLVSKHPLYIVSQGEYAFLDRWGGKKTMKYVTTDTLIRQNDSSYISKNRVLIKRGATWLLSDRLGVSTAVIFNRANSFQYNDWKSLYNWVCLMRLQDKLELLGVRNAIDVRGMLDACKKDSIEQYRGKLEEIELRYIHR